MLVQILLRQEIMQKPIILGKHQCGLKNKVGNKKDWDYKQQGREYENLEIGIMALYQKLQDYLNLVALSAAGGAQAKSHYNWNFELASAIDFITGYNPRGGYHGILDDPKDRAEIMRGFEAYDKNYGDTTNPMFERFLDDFKDFSDDFSFLFNPFDFRWQGKDPDWLEDIKDYWKNFFDSTVNPQIYDPITLDLNNDGKISTLNLSDGVYFDHNGDNIAFKTSWIGKDDGILVLDKTQIIKQIIWQ